MLQPRRILLAIDVGLWALGWAAFELGSSTWPLPPLHCGVIKVSKKHSKKDWWDRATIIMDDFESYALEFLVDTQGHTIKKLACEWPEFRSGSAMGLAAAARDNLTQLAYCCGAHAEMVRLNNPRVQVTMVPVSRWKGSLKKHVTNERVRRMIGDVAQDGTQFDTHAWDAVGVGLHVLGFKMDSEYARKSRG